VSESRIPFVEAIHEERLLKKQFFGDGTKAFPGLSKPQQVALKAIYGLPLDEEELLIWSAFQGGATYDPLGYPLSIAPIDYVPTERESTVLILGRRSGKTSQIMAFGVAYEATCGGHLDFVAKREECAIFLTAQKAEFAGRFISQFVYPILEDSPLLAQRIKLSNSDGIVLSSGFKGNNKTLGIRPAPPNIKAFRGPAIPVIGMDEAAFWYKDAESANPDYEVERAVEKAMAQFPFKKKFVASTPWTKEGIVFDAHNAGTDGLRIQNPEKRARFTGTLVLHAPTPFMQNPLLSKEWFERERAKDPEAYEREILALFVDAKDGIFPELLLKAATQGQPSTFGGDALADRDPIPGLMYVAAIDPAFKKDAFGFAITHFDSKLGVVHDVKRRWKAISSKEPLKPGPILDEIKPILDRYGILNVLSDQYHLESLQELAEERGFSIEGVPFTAAKKTGIYGTALMLARQNRWKLLDDEETYQELLLIEKHLLPQGGLHIGAPVGKHDDLATVVVLATWRAHQFRGAEAAPEEQKSNEDSIGERVRRHLEHKRSQVADEYDDSDEGYDEGE
jgi:hypothetical protein